QGGDEPVGVVDRAPVGPPHHAVHVHGHRHVGRRPTWSQVPPARSIPAPTMPWRQRPSSGPDERGRYRSEEPDRWTTRAVVLSTAARTAASSVHTDFAMANHVSATGVPDGASTRLSPEGRGSAAPARRSWATKLLTRSASRSSWPTSLAAA